MSTLTCPRCRQVTKVPAESSATPQACSSCGGDLALPGKQPARWFVTHRNQTLGPESWPRLLTRAVRGELDADDMLFKEGTSRWIRAGTLRALFTEGTAGTTLPAVDLPAALSSREAAEPSSISKESCEAKATQARLEVSAPVATHSDQAEPWADTPVHDSVSPADVPATPNAVDSLDAPPNPAVELGISTMGFPQTVPTVQDGSMACAVSAPTATVDKQPPLNWFMVAASVLNVVVLVVVVTLVANFVIAWSRPFERGQALDEESSAPPAKVAPAQAPKPGGVPSSSSGGR